MLPETFITGVELMQCPCGGMTANKSMRKAGRLAAEYKICKACGRIEWIWKSFKIERPSK